MSVSETVQFEMGAVCLDSIFDIFGGGGFCADAAEFAEHWADRIGTPLIFTYTDIHLYWY